MATKPRAEVVATAGMFLSITGMVHTVQSCGTRGRNRAAVLTAEDVAYFASAGVKHLACERCA